MTRKGSIMLVILLFIAAAGCGSQARQPTPTYQENKKMVLDMLKTNEGKQTFKELLEDKEMRNVIVLDEPVVKKTIIETLTTEQGKKIWIELLADPEFSDRLARTMQRENEGLLKKMMKDPGYQGMMMDVLKAPRLQEQYLDLMKTKPFREQLKLGVQEALTSPLFKKQLMEAIADTLKKQAGKGG